MSGLLAKPGGAPAEELPTPLSLSPSLSFSLLMQILIVGGKLHHRATTTSLHVLFDHVREKTKLEKGSRR